VLLFWVVLVFVGVKEFFDPIAMPEHFLFVFAGVAFLVEYFMNGKGVVGLAELEYSLSGGLTLVCAFACFYLSIRPSAFFADFLLSGGLVLKGTWVLQVGLSLYSDEFAFKGCGKVVDVRGEGSADVKCVLDEDRLRGVALTNLLFVGWLDTKVVLVFVGVKEFFDPIAMPEHFLFVFAGVAFLVEYLMNGKGVVGLAELEYSLLGGLTLVCAFACFYLSIRPSVFFADFLLSGGLVLKGTWVLQVGLSLYSDEFAFKGCGKVVDVRGEGSDDVKCVLDEDRLRGVALTNLLFVGHSIAVLILCFVIMGLLNRNKARTGELPMTAQIESDHLLMQEESVILHTLKDLVPAYTDFMPIEEIKKANLDLNMKVCEMINTITVPALVPNSPDSTSWITNNRVKGRFSTSKAWNDLRVDKPNGGSDAYAFKGCRKVVIAHGQGNADVNCDLDEDKIRMVWAGFDEFVVCWAFNCGVNIVFSDRNKAKTGELPMTAQIESEVVLVFAGVKEFFDPIAMPEHFLFDPIASMKGTRVLQVGLSFYSDAYAFKGCRKVVIAHGQGNADIKCDLDEDKIRVVWAGFDEFVVCWAFNCGVNIVFSDRNKARTGELPIRNCITEIAVNKFYCIKEIVVSNVIYCITEIAVNKF
nr:APC membrane recruitment protein like [Tanacetum cinerariifolium]